MKEERAKAKDHKKRKFKSSKKEHKKESHKHKKHKKSKHRHSSSSSSSSGSDSDHGGTSVLAQLERERQAVQAARYLLATQQDTRKSFREVGVAACSQGTPGVSTTCGCP